MIFKAKQLRERLKYGISKPVKGKEGIKPDQYEWVAGNKLEGEGGIPCRDVQREREMVLRTHRTRLVQSDCGHSESDSLSYGGHCMGPPGSP